MMHGQQNVKKSCTSYSLLSHARPEDGLIKKGRNM